ncbi:SERPIN domain-containing protein [Heracleum sosnowskyi]|uniref:SERPIN domain-containing protein n=1 Tax=Heracleum sosnowskyi TaxID=360622 RepID=A0AAD8MTB6_9APIA|nr:SERPIN domain-containing protein [Heracleum sosnowskyi]
MAQDHEFIKDTKQSRDGQSDVSLTLAKHLLLNDDKKSNLIFSPISIQIALSLLAAGSSGQTLDQLLTFLKAKTTDELNYLYSHVVDLVFVDGSLANGPCLSLANGVWLDKSSSLNPRFKHVVDNLYKAACHQVDFRNKFEEARLLVNSWVEKETNGLVRKILPPKSLSSSTMLVLANALYFKAEWMEMFDPDDTKDYDFYLLNGDSVKVPFMRMRGHQYISVFDGFKALKLPYAPVDWTQKPNGKGGWTYSCDKKPIFSMYIFLPDAKDGLPALVEKAGSESGFLDRHIPSESVLVGQFRIPKFKFEYKIELSEALKTIGLDSPFDPEEGLREMVAHGAPLIVSKIYHKAFIEVNEEGTVAAAATVVEEQLGFSLTEIKKVMIDFVADHPFLVFIREDKTGMVLFIGQVLDPSTT